MSVVIVGTLDTKGEEIEFTRTILEEQGVDVHVIDVGVIGDPTFPPDTSADAVAAEAGSSLQELRERSERGHAMEVMGAGAAQIASHLHEDGKLEGILGLGGSGNTSVATRAMRALPYGIPKLMVSTVASGDVRPYVGARDIMMLYSVADIEGLNQLTKRILSNAALSMVGMVSNDPDLDIVDRPTIAITMFGVTTTGVQYARDYLEEKGYEVLVFHATGTGGQSMEALIRAGVIDGVLDMTTTELADHLVGGVLSAGPDRLTAAADSDIPQVVSTGALDMVNFGALDTVPEEFQDRTLLVHNPEVTLMRTTVTECAELGKRLAEKVNKSTAPCSVMLPLAGVSQIAVDGEEFYDPAADSALFDSIRETIADHVDLDEREMAINDEAFAVAAARTLDAYMSG